MVTTGDLLYLPFTPDLTEGGIAFACRSLPHVYDRKPGSPFDRLRHVVAGVAVELAFRRYLTQNNIPFGVKGSAPFTDPDRYDVSLGGHRCDIRSFLISHKRQISALHSDLGLVLDAQALVPLDQFASEDSSSQDLYLFAFLTGLIAASSSSVQKASAAGQPTWLLYLMPQTWIRPLGWIPLGPLILKSESDEMLRLEIGGQDGDREFLVRSLELPPHRRVQLDVDFHSLSYLHVETRPSARLGIHSPARDETHLIESSEWNNVWVYGMDIYLAGWISREEFRQRASIVNEGSRVFQYNQTRTRNLAVPVSELRRLPELFERVREWAVSK